MHYLTKLGLTVSKLERWYIRNQFQRIKRTIEFLDEFGIPLENILDVGCGNGLFLLTLGKTGIGLDLPYEVEICRLRGIEVYPVNLEQESFPFPDCSFDLVTCLEVIEHLETPGLMLSEIRRVLKKRGFVLISTPNVKSLHWRLANLLWRNPVWPWIRTGKWLPRKKRLSHVRYYSAEELLLLLEQYGFDVIASFGLKMAMSSNDNFLILAC